jgi:hypothetical protein
MNKFKGNLVLIASLLYALSAIAEHQPNHHLQHHAEKVTSVLTESGTDIFATVQEVITRLEADPNTDWSKVNLERLRQHLRDMFEFSYNVDVISQQAIEQGVKIVVKATTPRAEKALTRVLNAHPAMLKIETGWTMRSQLQKDRYEITVTTNKPSEIDKIRGLGYIGLLAYGKHHQAHHWSMATGLNPHHAMHHQ